MKTKREIRRCECGKRINSYAHECNACREARMSKVYEEAQAVWDSGVCPECGSALRRNISLAGWVQCEQYGADGFRKDSSKPQCSFQTFLRS